MAHDENKNRFSEGCAGCAAREVVDVGKRSFIGAALGAGSMLIGAIVGAPLFRFVLYPVYAKASLGKAMAR